MPLGRKVADIYAELNLDKDELRRAMAAASGEMGADADRLGRSLGDRMSQGMAGQVEALSTKLAKARLAEQKATDAVTLSQARLTEARDKGNVTGSRMLALEQKLTQAESALAIAHDNTAKASIRHADAEKRLVTDLENLGETAGPAADRAGQDTGDKLTQGIHLAIIRNSPLIAAGVSAALAAGAPVALAGATAMFAGIGIAAAAQSEKVQSAWLGTWTDIKAGAESDASVIEPVLINMADRVDARFQAMRPVLRNIFADAAPQIAVFTNGLLDAADNALPGFQRAVGASMPVTQGLSDLVSRTGQGLGDFFTVISQHGPAAGAVFRDLGADVGTLLPILGDLLGTGVEVASTVLPALGGGLHLVLDAVNLLGPAAPLVATGIGTWRIATTASGWLDGLANKMDASAAASGRFSGAMGAASSTVRGIGNALPAIGMAVGVLSSLWESQTRTVESWADAMIQGGVAADQATAEIQRQQDAVNANVLDLNGFGQVWERMKGLWNDGVAQLEGYSSAEDQASQKAKALLAAMDPITRAQTLQKQALNDLNDALEKHGQGSASAEVAERKYKDASDAVTDAEKRQELAIHGVTQAMMDQVDEARSAIDSNFALQHAQNQQRDAEAALADAIKQHGRSSVEAHDAQQAYVESIYNTAAAAGQLAADQSGLKQGTLEYNNVLNTQLLKSLLAVRDSLSGPTRDAVDGMIAQLQSAGATTDGVGKKLDTLGTKNPKPTIGPATDNVTPQVDNLMNSLFDLGQAHPVPQADLDTKPAERNKDVMMGMLGALGAQTPTPTVGMNPGPFNLVSGQVEAGIINLGAQTPTPIAGLNPAPFNVNWAGVMGNLGILAGQVPTPVVGLNPGPYNAIAAQVLGSIWNLGGQNPTPTAWLRDQASWVVQQIINNMAALHDKTVTVTTNQILRTYYASTNAGPALAGPDHARGGKVGLATGGQVGDVLGLMGHRFADGGVFSGKLFGPGGPTDDLIQAVTNMGAPLRVSNDEWVIKGSSSAKYGDAKMSAVNDGRAVITVPGPRPSARFATGGSPASEIGGSAVTDRPIVVQNLSVNIQGVWDLTNPQQVQKVGKVLRDVIVKIERSEH